MSSLRYFVVHAFAEKKYAGNQLAVFVDSGDLPDSYKQRIAKETNYLETTADFDLRFPTQQVSTGIPFVIAPAKTLAAVQRAKPCRDRYIEPKQSLSSALRDCVRTLSPHGGVALVCGVCQCSGSSH
jgi:predicted PhzF superfamily epimerase YddE/YHI9